MTAFQLALLGLLVQAVNTFLASMPDARYRVTSADVRLTRKGGWVMIALPVDRERRR